MFGMTNIRSTDISVHVHLAPVNEVRVVVLEQDVRGASSSAGSVEQRSNDAYDDRT